MREIDGWMEMEEEEVTCEAFIKRRRCRRLSRRGTTTKKGIFYVSIDGFAFSPWRNNAFSSNFCSLNRKWKESRSSRGITFQFLMCESVKAGIEFLHMWGAKRGALVWSGLHMSLTWDVSAGVCDVALPLALSPAALIPRRRAPFQRNRSRSRWKSTPRLMKNWASTTAAASTDAASLDNGTRVSLTRGCSSDGDRLLPTGNAHAPSSK